MNPEKRTMNKTYYIFAIPALILGLTLNLSAHENSAAAMQSAKLKLQAKDFAGASKDADEALAMAGGNASQKFEALLFKAQIAETSKNFAGAKEEYAKILADANATPLYKIKAHNKIANVLITENKMDEARAEYAKIANVAGAKLTDILEAKISTAKSYERQMAHEQAAQIYTGICADPAATRPYKIQAVRANAALLMGKFEFDAARAEYAKILSLPDCGAKEKADVAMDIAVTYGKNYLQAREEYKKALAVEGLDAKGKVAVLKAIAKTFKEEGDLAHMKETLGAIAELVPAPDYLLLRDYAVLAGSREDAVEEEWAWTQVMAVPALGAAQYSDAVFKRIAALAANQRIEDAKKLTTEAMADPRVNGEEKKYLSSLLLAGFGAAKGGLVDSKAIPATTLGAETQAKLLADAGKIFMRAGNYEVARYFGNKADAMFPAASRPVYECKFMDKAPIGVGGWEHSEIVKAPSRREARFQEYNKKAAALLINDVNVVREVSTDGSKESKMGFYMAADARGWHIYVHSQNDQVEQLLAGLAPGGSLEMYFAPGKGEAYYQCLLNLPSGKTSYIWWMSPSRHFRKMDDYCKTEVAPVADGLGAYIFLSWDLVYDKLPKEGDLWPFGLVDFGPNGAFSWGSGQVHELNKFGRIKFAGIEKSLPAIKRGIVTRAFGSYKKSSNAATTLWNDEVKGDLNFYNQKLLPQVEKLNELGKLVSPEMSQADVDMLFEKAVPSWMEFDYLVSELRSDFIRNKLFVD